MHPEPDAAEPHDMPRAVDDGFGGEDFFELSLDNLCVAGLDGYLKRVNPSWTRTLGWSAAELLSRPSIEFVHPEDRELTLAGRARLARGDALGSLVNRYVCKDGSVRWFEWRSVVQAERGLVYAAARDITEQKLAEARLQEAQQREARLQRQLVFADRMASVGTLAAGVAHEINNPLGAVTANLALLLEGLVDADAQSNNHAERAHMLREAQQGAERIRVIVRGLQTFSRAEVERRAPVDPRPLLELSISMTSNEIRPRAQIVREYGPIPRVLADEARLGQVFLNLLLNAAHAIPEGDHTSHEIRVVTGTDAHGGAVVEVHDTGVGIPEEVVDRIFDPFFTTKGVGEGTGLGLSIAHTITTGLGGVITVARAATRGTTLRVVLPAAPASERAPALPEPAPNETSRKSVLVVDDEPAIGSVLRRVLRDHEVTTLTHAGEALELLATGKHFDVVFSDLMMPEMSGMDFFGHIEARFPELAERVVFISGGAYTPAAHAFLDRVSNARIDKPFDPRTVRELVRRSGP